MLLPRTSLLVPLVACLASLSHADQYPMYLRCNLPDSDLSNCQQNKEGEKYEAFGLRVRTSEIEENGLFAFGNSQPHSKRCKTDSHYGHLNTVSFILLDGTQYNCPVDDYNKSFLDKFLEKDTSVGDAYHSFTGDEIYPFDEKTSIFWNALDKDPISFKCYHPKLHVQYYGQAKVAIDAGWREDCGRNLETMLDRMEKRREQLSTILPGGSEYEKAKARWGNGAPINLNVAPLEDDGDTHLSKQEKSSSLGVLRKVGGY